MANPILVKGLLPYDTLYLCRSGPRWRFRAARHPAVGETQIAELACSADDPRTLSPGPWKQAGPLDLRDWVAYGRINHETQFVSLYAEQDHPNRATGEQLALALPPDPGEASAGPGEPGGSKQEPSK